VRAAAEICLLALRREKILPRLGNISGGEAAYRLVCERCLSVRWTLGDGSLLTLLANQGAVGDGPELPAWSVAWYLRESG
jgi:hypothetical protein